jgi:hypothetical protein
LDFYRLLSCDRDSDWPERGICREIPDIPRKWLSKCPSLQLRRFLPNKRPAGFDSATLSEVEGYALSEVEGCALSKLEGCALSEVEGCALSKLEGARQRVKSFLEISLIQ